ncbi:DGQHR domain-containing protein [Vibrio sp. Hal054]|uniref:DGQHR domain-containing protein n=1 Tax=Vibrio sp. Hal054 TaxID=3035158 RepID=UPI00301D62CC
MENYQPIHAPNEKSLPLTLFVGNEGIVKTGARVFEGVLTGRELAEYFDIEKPSSLYPDYMKRQRDLEKTRATKLIKYFEDREDTILPSLIIFVSHLTHEEEIMVGNRKMVVAELPHDADRLIGDGQNRRNLYAHIINQQPWRAEETVNVKFVCVDDVSLEAHGTLAKQTFSDLHFNLAKPTTSLNLYFDSSQPYRKMLDRFLNIETHGTTVRSFISTTGKAKPESILMLNQLLDFIGTALGKTAATINKLLKKQPDLEHELFERYGPVVESFFNLCPMEHIAKVNKDDAMFTKFIFAKAVAWVAKSIVEQAVDEALMDAEDQGIEFNAKNVLIDFSKIEALNKLPLYDMTDKVWLDAGAVTKVVDDEKGTVKFKMVRGSEKILARTLCRRIRVQPSKDI